MVGSDVLFNGLDVGEVTNLSLVPDNPGQVVAIIGVDSRTPVRTDTHVGLVFGGLTGTAAVALTGGTATAPVLNSGDGEPPLLIADAAAIKDMTQLARDALAHFDALLTDNSAALTEAIANIGTFSAALGRNSDKVDGILQGLEKLTGGSKTETQVNYDLTAPSAFPPVATLPSAQLAVPAPTTVITIDTQRILIQSADGEAPAFSNVRSADNIPVLFQARIIQGFENAQYLRVGTDAGDLTADYKLAIDIRHFRATTSAGPATAEVEFSTKVPDADGKVAGARIFSASSPVTATDNAAIAAMALDTVFGKAAADLIVWILTTINVSSAAAGEPTTTP